jgi:hypothetical protein
MADIFLSYTEKDRDVVRHLAERLEATGWSVWWDRRIPAGLTWRSVLERELQQMHCMVVLWSRHSVASEWVCEEAAEGRQLGRLVPVLIEHVRPPAGFREIQAADLVGWDGSQDSLGLRRLVEDIERLIGRPGAVMPAAAAAPVADRKNPEAVPQGFPWGVSALLVVIAIAAYFGTLARKPVEPKADAARAPAQALPAAPAATAMPKAAPAASVAASAGAQAGPESSWSTASRCAALRERLALGQSMSGKSQAFFRGECGP